MKITYLGHSAFLVEAQGFKGLMDPFISGNPSCPVSLDHLEGITHIFVTHGHGDHLGDTEKIPGNPLVICNFEIAHYLSQKNKKVHAMHIGGRKKMDFGCVKMTPALHGSGILTQEGMIEGGSPCGFILEIEGKKLYHAGDTGLSMEMKLLEKENIHVALLPIGGNFTMDIEDAVRAVEFIQPKLVIPMHYKTFDVIDVDPKDFKAKVQAIPVEILSPGQSYQF